MKKFILIITAFLFCSSVVNSQNITIKTLESITKMSSNEFEDWAVNQGYSFYKFEKDVYFDVLYYKKGNSGILILALNKNGTPFGNVNYQTSNSSEYLSLKKNCINFGYKFVKSENIDVNGKTSILHNYKSSN